MSESLIICNYINTLHQNYQNFKRVYEDRLSNINDPQKKRIVIVAVNAFGSLSRSSWL